MNSDYLKKYLQRTCLRCAVVVMLVLRPSMRVMCRPLTARCSALRPAAEGEKKKKKQTKAKPVKHATVRIFDDDAQCVMSYYHAILLPFLHGSAASFISVPFYEYSCEYHFA